VHEALDRLVEVAVERADGIPLRQADADNVDAGDRGLWSLPLPGAGKPTEMQQGFTRYTAEYMIRGSWYLPGDDTPLDWGKIHEEIDRLIYEIDRLGAHECSNGHVSGFRSGSFMFTEGDDDDEVVVVLKFTVLYQMHRALPA